MKVFRRLEIKLRDKHSLSELINTVGEVCTSNGLVNSEILFYMSDSAGGKISAVDRVVKKFPELKEFKFLSPSIAARSRFIKSILIKADFLFSHPLNILSNLSSEWDYTNPNRVYKSIPFALLQTIAVGVPKAYPCGGVTIIFDKINWDEGNVPETISNEGKLKPIRAENYLSPAIIIRNDWENSNKLSFKLWFILNLNIDRSDYSIPKLSDDLEVIISHFGEVRLEEFIAVPSNKEKERINQIDNKIKRLFFLTRLKIPFIIRSLQLPYKLPKRLIEGEDNSSQIKRLLMDIFKAKGYDYFSQYGGNGLYCLNKRTPNNNQLSLLFDYSRMLNLLSCDLVFKTPFLEHRLELQFTPHFWYSQYEVKGSDNLLKVLENVSAIVEYLESTLINEVDSLYGPTPQWFQYQN